MLALYQNLVNKELIVLNIFKYKYCVNKSRGMSSDH